MKNGSLRGVIAAIATAIDEAGAPDERRSVALARFLLDNGCDGLNVLGTTGEYATLSHADYEAFAGCVLETVKRRVPVIVGTTALCVTRCVCTASSHAPGSNCGRTTILRPPQTDESIVVAPAT